MPIKTVTIFIILIVMSVTMATGYSIFKSELKVNGTITAMHKVDIEIPEVGEDENGVTRFTGDSNFNSPLLGREVFRVIEETAEGNTITTMLKAINTTFIGIKLVANAEITLTIENNSGKTFSNGSIEIVEYMDTGEAVTNESHTLSKTTVENGDTAVATIAGDMYSANVVAGTYYKYKISFDVNGITENYYYILNMIPKE